MYTFQTIFVLHVLRRLSNIFFSTEYEVDEALSYEEVTLMRPDPSRKRPVVLIGMYETKHDT